MDWYSGQQETIHSTSDAAIGWTGLTAGVGGLSLLGRYQFGSRTGFDYLSDFAKYIEEYSPGHIFRTFQTSAHLSPLTTAGQQYRFVSPQSISNLMGSSTGTAWLEHLSRVAGEDIFQPDVLEEGFRFEGGQIRVGRTGGRVLVRNAGIMSTTPGALPGGMIAYARSLRGGSISDRVAEGGVAAAEMETSFARRVFTQVIPTESATGKPLHGDIWNVTGGQSRLQQFGRRLMGYGTENVERINQLARAPFSMEPFESIFKKAPILNRIGFEVVSSSGLRTLGKITGKLGILGTAAYLGYEEIDAITRNSSILNGTLFDEGISAAIGTVVTSTNMALSKIAEFTGGHTYRETQEDIAPGSTELSRLAAFPLMGALGGMGLSYGEKLLRQIGHQRAGLSLEQASAAASFRDLFFREQIYSDFEIPKNLLLGMDEATTNLLQAEGMELSQKRIGDAARWVAAKQEKSFFRGGALRLLGPISPVKLKMLAGAGVGLGLVLPFLPGALVPSERPEELEKLYSGEKEVAVRKGRFWEMSRCLTKSTTCELINGTIKTAEKIEIGDVLIGRDNKPTKVLSVFVRQINEEVLHFSTAFDRSFITGLTKNHIVPVLRKNKIIEIPAEDIQINDFVETPYKKLQDNIQIINCAEHITRFPIWIENNKIFSAQTNWFSRKIQKSGQCSIPLILDLDYDLGLLFGYYLAEGNLSFHDSSPSFVETVHAKHEEWIIEDIRRICQQKFNTKITQRFKTTGKKVKEGAWIVRICSSILAKLFFGLFYSENNDAGLKDIPKIFNSANNEFKQGLIEGYFRGDGCFDGQTKKIDSARKWLVQTCQLYALNAEQPAGLTFQKTDYKGNWSLRFFSSAPCTGMKFVEGRLFSRIRSISIEFYSDLVYDFEVDSEDHLYKAGTFLVHNSPWEGENITRYEKHWYPKMLARGKEKAIWGEDAPGPLEQWWRANTSYELELRHWRDRPYPVSSVFGQEIPFIGPIVAATVGKLIKSPKLMHTESWLRTSDQSTSEYLPMPLRFGESEPNKMLEETTPGAPVSPYGIKGVIGEQIYRWSQMTGLTGFRDTSIKEAITGEADTFAQEQQLESAGKISSLGRGWWDREIGGGLGTTELLRRLYPNPRKIPKYNPIPNAFADVDWLPGEGDRSENFKVGDPFARIPLGETRLPGPGFAAENPEVAGLHPRDYPSIYRLKILSDISPHSEKYKTALSDVRADIAGGKLSEKHMEMFREIQRQVTEKKKRKKFAEYRYADMAPTKWSSILSEKKERSPGILQSILGTYWEQLVHRSETPLEFLTPVSPAKKLVHQRSAVEDYAATNVWGTQRGFWSHPIEDFIKPTLSSFGKMIGIDRIPSRVSRMRKLEEQFDILEYIKQTSLREKYLQRGDEEAAAGAEKKRGATLFGLNPYSFNFSDIYRSLPRRDRDYFEAFSETRSTEERAEILKMIPENEKALYVAKWEAADASDIKKAINKELLSSKQMEEAQSELSKYRENMKTEGFPESIELWKQYISTRLQGESYSDWYRRYILIPEKLEMLPGPDWVAWSPYVEMSDVKMKVVENVGDSLFDYDIWPDQARAGVRKPYLDSAADELEGQLSSDEIRERLDRLLSSHGIQDTHIEIESIAGSSQIDARFEEDRMDEMIRYGRHF